MQKHVNLVDLVKSFPTNSFLQKLASIQKRTSPLKFAHLAEKSGNGSISNLSTKADTAVVGLLVLLAACPHGNPAPIELLVQGAFLIVRALIQQRAPDSSVAAVQDKAE